MIAVVQHPLDRVPNRDDRLLVEALVETAKFAGEFSVVCGGQIRQPCVQPILERLLAHLESEVASKALVGIRINVKLTEVGAPQGAFGH